MKRFCVFLFACLFLLFFCTSCGRQDPDVTAEITTENIALSAETFVGLWRTDNMPFSFITLRSDFSYLALDEAEQFYKEGYFLVEGEYLVLDGYGTDDLDAFLVIFYDAESNTFSGTFSDAPFTLHYAGANPLKPALDLSAWLGVFRSAAGRVSIGKSDREGEALVAITPGGAGQTLSDRVIFDSESEAEGQKIHLSLNDNVLIVEAVSDEAEPFIGEYNRFS